MTDQPPPQQPNLPPPQQPNLPPPQQPNLPPPQQPGYGHPQQPYAAPQQPLTPDQERNWATLAHVIPLVAMVVSAGTLGFVGSLVIYLLYKDRGPFVRWHAANSLNVQIITGIVLLISFPFMLVGIGFLTYGLALVFAFVVHIIAAAKANQGEWFRPPMTPNWVK